MSHDPEDWCKIWRKTICCFKNERNLVNFDPSTRSPKNLHFHWFVLCKVFNVWPKKSQRSYLWWHWKVMQNLKKNWLEVWKMTWGIWWIFTRALEVSKLELWWDPFAQSRKCMSLKFTDKLCLVTMKNDAKFEEELTCHLKIDMQNLTNFDSNTQKSKKICSLIGSFDQRI